MAALTSAHHALFPIMPSSPPWTVSGARGTPYFLASDPVEHTGVRRIYPLEKVCARAMHKREEEPVAV